jgi:hypothetical protein
MKYPSFDVGSKLSTPRGATGPSDEPVGANVNFVTDTGPAPSTELVRHHPPFVPRNDVPPVLNMLPPM